MTAETAEEPLCPVLVDALRRLSCRQAFERGARLEDLDRLGVRDMADAGAAMALADDEPLLLEPDEGVANRAARHLKGRGQVGFHEPRVGRDVTAHDRVTKIVVVAHGFFSSGLVLSVTACSPK